MDGLDQYGDYNAERSSRPQRRSSRRLREPPVGADLFQDFSALAPGNYTLTFFVENQSSWDANLVLAIQQYLGTPISELFAAGTAEELSLPASMTSFAKETFNFTITPNEQFIPQELTFSNSYDAPISPITNSINPPGTIINIADVSLTLNQSPAISGTVANQPALTLHPFGQVVISDLNANQTETITITRVENAGNPLSNAALYGILIDPNAAKDGSTNVNGVYTVTGSAAAVTHDLKSCSARRGPILQTTPLR